MGTVDKTWLNVGETLAKVPTPAVFYSEAIIAKNVAMYLAVAREVPRPSLKLRYALKACSLHRVLRTIARLGLGVDCQSLGEAALARHGGFDRQQIVLLSPRLGAREIRWAINNGCKLICDSVSQLRLVDRLSQKASSHWRIGIRVSLPVAGTERFRTKLGMDSKSISSQLGTISSTTRSRIDEIHHHGAACETDGRLLIESARQLGLFVKSIERRFGLHFSTVNLGGGLDAPSVVVEQHDSTISIIRECMAIVRETLPGDTRSVVLEPGRAIVKDAALAVTTVVHTKELWNKKLAVVDLSTNFLIPLPLSRFSASREGYGRKRKARFRYGIVDGTCSPAGFLVRDAPLGRICEGDRLWIWNVGAYTWSLAESFYDHLPCVYWLDSRGKLSNVFSRSAGHEVMRILSGR